MSSSGGIGGGGGIRLAVQQSLAPTGPKLSFGPRLQQVSPLVATLEDLATAVADIENYARLHSPALMGDLARLRTQLKSIADRSA